MQSSTQAVTERTTVPILLSTATSSPNNVPVPFNIQGMEVWELDARIQAGFPSPAEDLGGKRIDVLEKLIKHPQATYQMSVQGESMRDAGIFNGDVVLIDKAISPKNGQIVVAVVDGEFTIKRLAMRAGRIKLMAANPTFPDIVPKEGQEVVIWGVVVASITMHRT